MSNRNKLGKAQLAKLRNIQRLQGFNYRKNRGIMPIARMRKTAPTILEKKSRQKSLSSKVV